MAAINMSCKDITSTTLRTLEVKDRAIRFCMSCAWDTNCLVTNVHRTGWKRIALAVSTGAPSLRLPHVPRSRALSQSRRCGAGALGPQDPSRLQGSPSHRALPTPTRGQADGRTGVLAALLRGLAPSTAATGSTPVPRVSAPVTVAASCRAEGGVWLARRCDL